MGFLVFYLVVMGIAAVDLGSIWTLGIHIKWDLMIPSSFFSLHSS
ncbi:hypothetical protein CABS01_04556 [Colletotrichum abscissum]|nr:uncharacterized protein CABS01_04556 [Colletotrichum abscissum]KAK1471913.1 hypothetical protein CABS01_04556 [Colletotrichum abscissum]